MNRLAYRLYRIISTIRYRLGRRFTKAGLLVLGGLVMTGGLAMDTDQSVAYQSFAILFCLLAVAISCAPFFRARFTVRRSLPRLGSVGEALTYRVLVQNKTARAQTGLTLLENLADLRRTFQEFSEAMRPSKKRRSFQISARASRPSRAVSVKEAALPPLPPRGEVEARLELTPLRRGPLRFAGATLARPDPFGLFRSFVTVPLAGKILILPKRYALPPIALPGSRQYQQGGVALAAAIGESEEFVSLRDYRRGDPLRHIHWKSWARTGRPIVKEFQDEFFVRHALILDTFAGPEQAEVFEEAVSLAASFACTIQTQESLLDLMFVGPQAFCFTVGRGVAHADQMLEILASVSPCREQSFGALRNLVLEHTAAVSGCICIFVDWDERRKELVRQLQAMGLPLLVFIVREAGANEPLDPGPLRDAPETFHALEAGKMAEGLGKL